MKFSNECLWITGFPGSSDGKEFAPSVGDPGLISRLGKSPGEGNGNPLQYSCQRIPDRRAWQAIVYGSKRVRHYCKEIKLVHPKGDQSLVFIRRTDAKAETPVLWPPHVKSWLSGKDPDAGRDWGQEEKGTTENEMAGWHHWVDGREF